MVKAGLHLARQVMYANLAESFLQPPAADFPPWRPPDRMLGRLPRQAGRPEVAEGLDMVREWHIAAATKSLSEVLGELRLDYTRLFMGPGQVLAPPWESVYRSPKRLLFQEPTAQVRVFYRRHGLEVPRLNQEPDDHFGLELAFMAVLAERTVAAVGKSGRSLSQTGAARAAGGDGKGQEGVGPNPVAHLLAEQHRFLREHLGQWVNDFTQDVQKHAATVYFRGLALVARGLVLADEEWLAELIDG